LILFLEIPKDLFTTIDATKVSEYQMMMYNSPDLNLKFKLKNPESSFYMYFFSTVCMGCSTLLKNCAIL